MQEATRILVDRFKDAKTAINSRYQIASFLESKGYHIESNRQIRCPFHDDSTPSFSVNTDSNIWKCFGCPDGGHFLDLWIRYEQKYNSKEYSAYLAVETILGADKELQDALGFATIFQTEETQFDLFEHAAQETGFFDFDKVLKRESACKKVDTTSMKDVLAVLKEDPDSIIRFIADCENGLTDAQLISRYFRKQDTLEDYIADLISDSKVEDNDSITQELLGVLND